MTESDGRLPNMSLCGLPEVQAVTSRSAIFSIRPTSDDVNHHGMLLQFPGVTQKEFRANLGYTLLLEYVEARVAKLSPAGRTKIQTDEALSALSRQVLSLGTLPLSAQALGLYQDTGMQARERQLENMEKGQALRPGEAIEITEDDRMTISQQVRVAWAAWWSGVAP